MNKAKLTYLFNPNYSKIVKTTSLYHQQYKGILTTIKDNTEILTSRFERQVVNPSNKTRTAKCKQIIKIIKNLNHQKAASPGKNSIKICKSCSKYNLFTFNKHCKY